jgi:hypothetical protein
MFTRTAPSYLPMDLDRQPVEGNGACAGGIW